MVSQRAAALAVFIAVIILGSVSVLVLIRSIRERQRRGDDLSAFLTDFSSGERNVSLAGAPAVVFKHENETIYVDEPAREAKIFIVTRNYPDSEIVRKFIENRRNKIYQIAQKSLELRSEGVVVIDNKALLIRPFRLDDGKLKADLWEVDGNQVRKAGSLEIVSRDDEVIQGVIELYREGDLIKYDVFIPRNFPNTSNLCQKVKIARPLNKSAALTALKVARVNLTKVESKPSVSAISPSSK